MWPPVDPAVQLLRDGSADDLQRATGELGSAGATVRARAVAAATVGCWRNVLSFFDQEEFLVV